MPFPESTEGMEESLNFWAATRTDGVGEELWIGCLKKQVTVIVAYFTNGKCVTEDGGRRIGTWRGVDPAGGR